MRQIVTATQIDKWFESMSRDAQELLPHLIRKLITITVDPKDLVAIRIPVGDQVNLPGYDGIVITAAPHMYVPEKQSVWEMGTGDPKEKANRVYDSRKKDPGEIDQKTTTFVFVTPHEFRGRDAWLREKRSEGLWKDIVVIDVVDLDNWLEQNFGVARWLARQMGVPVDGVYDLEGFKKEEIDARYGIDISSQLIIAGRNDAVSQLQNWIFSDSKEIRLEGDSVEEGAAFVTAAFSTLQDKDREAVISRVLFVTNISILDYLTTIRGSYIIVALNSEVRRKAVALTSPQIRVIFPLPRSPGIGTYNASSIILGPIGRHACEEALVELRFLRQKAETIARESKGKLAAVFWMIGKETDTPPRWTTPAAAYELVPILLCGQWVIDNEADKNALAQISSSDYADVESRTVKWMHPVGPLVRRGPLMDWLAWQYAWTCLAPFIERSHITNFLTVAKSILETLDPKLELDNQQRWAAAMFGKEHPYSSPLRTGLVGSLAQLAINSPYLTSVGGQAIADRFVEELLGGEGVLRNGIWLSVAQWLPDLAEAAPNVFLRKLDDALKDKDFVLILFEESGIFGWSAHTYVLWALERLAWSNHLLSQVMLVLGELADVDPGGKTSNRPSNSLTGIFLPWHPRTEASLTEQFDAIDLLYSQKPRIAWSLAVSLLPDETRVAFPTAEPQWRSWKPFDERKVTTKDYWFFIDELIQRMTRWAETSGERWASLVEAYNPLRVGYPKLANQLISSLEKLSPQSFSETDRGFLAESLRKQLAHHRDCSEAAWAMNDQQLEPLQALYERLKPENPVGQNMWLFTSWPDIPRSMELSHEQHMQMVQDARRKAVELIYSSQALSGIYSLAEKVERPEEIGMALSHISTEENFESDFLRHSLGSVVTKNEIPALLRVAWGYILGMYRQYGSTWMQRVTANSKISWDSNRYTNFALGLPAEPNTWDKVADWGSDVDNFYWEKTPIHYLEDPERDGKRVVERLLRAGRPYRALDLCAMSVRIATRGQTDSDILPIPSDLVIRILEEAPKFDPTNEWYPPSLTSIGHHVEQLLNILEKHGTNAPILVKLEWIWLPLLEHGTRRLKSLQGALSSDPGLFVEFLKIVFRGDNDKPHDLSDQEKVKAQQAYRLLEAWKTPPGLLSTEEIQDRDDGDIVFSNGRIDEVALVNWITTARKLAQECGRQDICDSRIGQVLAYAPKDDDDTWPCAAIRNVIETIKSDKLERGVSIGVYNKRGVHWRAKGGVQEKLLAEKFATYATRIQSKYPRTAAMLRAIALGFEHDARREAETDSIEEFE